MANILTEKIGPLQGWMWGAGALTVGYLYFRMSSKSAGSTPQGGQPQTPSAASAQGLLPIIYQQPSSTASSSSSSSSSSTGPTVTLRGYQSSGYHAPWDTVEPGLPFYTAAGAQWAGESSVLPWSSTWPLGPKGTQGGQTQILGPGGTPVWINTEDIASYSQGSGGSGGRSGIGGWTGGWLPLSNPRTRGRGAGPATGTFRYTDRAKKLRNTPALGQ